MTVLRNIRPLLLAGLILLVFSERAAAYPFLQLGIGGGVYNNATETITATGRSFTLYAYLTPAPHTSAADLQTLLSRTYYIAAALTPQVKVASNLGSFAFNGQTVRATQDMVYGNPPFETYLGGAAYDAGDLAKHDIYDTYFKEFSFTFSPLRRSVAFDTAQNPGQAPMAAHNGGMYYTSFTVNTSHLDPRYQVHFDMYDEVLRHGGDIDILHFAPFSHDAQSFAVPEPGSLFLLGSGIAALVARQRRRRHSSKPH